LSEIEQSAVELQRFKDWKSGEGEASAILEVHGAIPEAVVLNVTHTVRQRYILLQNAPDRSRRLTETVDQFFFDNSGIIFLAPYPFQL